MLRRLPAGGPPDWSVYMLRCGDGTLYTGVAKDVDARLDKHACGKGARYTRAHLPVALVYRRGGFTRSEALVEEARIKTLGRRGKEKLIN